MGALIDRILSLTGEIEDWILQIADAWWVHLVVYAFSALDGFFPSVPSESTIVTLSSLWSSSGKPSILLVGLAAWVGAFTGDNLGYLIGSKIGWERFRFLREGRGRRAVEAAESGLRKRALIFLMTARYIPFGRTAVNLVAGAVHYPHRQFWPRSLLSTFVWAVYSCAIGAVAGAWFENNHLLAITVALIAAIVMALIVERAITAVHRWLDRRAERREDAEQLADRTEAEQNPVQQDRAEHAPAEHAPAEQVPAGRTRVEQDPTGRTRVEQDATGRTPAEQDHAEKASVRPLTTPSQGEDTPA